ncbi:hypothetical protein [Thioclava sp.]|uniref:hypothetical protein n=1 Tax=Thioclava sp. TaxID=1933450 RepID=UPI003AA87B53
MTGRNTNARIETPRRTAPFHSMNGRIAALGFIVFGFEIEHGGASQARTTGIKAADAAHVDANAAGVTTQLPADAIFYAACPHMFAGGQDRVAAAQNRFGVHQEHIDPASPRDSAQTALDVQQSTAQVMRYPGEMGLNLGLMEPKMATPPDRIHVLSALELVRYHLTTSPRPS